MAKAATFQEAADVFAELQRLRMAVSTQVRQYVSITSMMEEGAQRVCTQRSDGDQVATQCGFKIAPCRASCPAYTQSAFVWDEFQACGGVCSHDKQKPPTASGQTKSVTG